MQDWISSIKWANDEEQVKIVIVTGKGNFFCSGLELPNVPSDMEELKRTAEANNNLFKYVDSKLRKRKYKIK